jgi:hypothetical protein
MVIHCRLLVSCSWQTSPPTKRQLGVDWAIEQT